MKALISAGLKLCMFGLFASWAWTHRRDRTPEGSVAEPDASFIRKLLLFSLAMYAILAGIFLSCPYESALVQVVFYLFALALTLLLECGMAALWGYRSMKELYCVALCSLVTHPTLHLFAFLPEALFGENLFDEHRVWFPEAMVVVAESRLLNRLLPWRRADNAKLALAMNAFSFLAGWAILEALWRILS
ncbi:MAG: hypothetical protein LBQ90_07755 [Synergistaceae bacterium]|jgi:hypothetical protein|nr:hypothetical protein [Synergistaceae bacterium]